MGSKSPKVRQYMFRMPILLLIVSLQILSLFTLTVNTTTYADFALEIRLEGLTLSPSVAMTSGAVKAWKEDDWIPIRLTIVNNGPATTLTISLDQEYKNADRIGIDAFASCFAIASSPYCGSGGSPNSGTKWKLLVGSVEQTPSVSFSSVAGVTAIRWLLSSVVVPSGSSPSLGQLEIKWAVHLAKSGADNLVCKDSNSPLVSCSPPTVASGSGSSSWPGKSLQVRVNMPPGERTLPIDPPGQRCIIATAAYGSEIAGPVQFLRTFRDEQVEATISGMAFMEAFNNWYYSWAPAVAGRVAHDDAMSSVVRAIVIPLLGVLYVGREIFEIFRSLNPEVAGLIAGIVASALIGVVYIFPVAYVIKRLTRRAVTHKTFFYVGISGLALTLFGTLTNGTFGIMQNSTALLVVEAMLLAPSAIIRKFVQA